MATPGHGAGDSFRLLPLENASSVGCSGPAHFAAVMRARQRHVVADAAIG